MNICGQTGKKKKYDEMQFYVRSGNNNIVETMGQEIYFPSISIVISLH
jgi:hypothetical protein